MHRIGIRELRQGASRCLARVKKREEVEANERFSAPPTVTNAPTNRELLDAERAERL